eukprot:11193145-Lingulodinium_polyedra.AAC.1
MALLPGMEDPCIERGRAVAAHIAAGPRGGLAVVSTYLRDGEGWSAANTATAWRVLEALASVQGPVLWAGDFNMTVQELLKPGFIQRAGLYVVAAGKPTCKAGGGREIDYFLVNQQLLTLLRGVEVQDGPFYPQPCAAQHPGRDASVACQGLGAA